MEKDKDPEILYYEEIEKKNKSLPYKNELYDIETALEKHNKLVDEFLSTKGKTRNRKII